MAMSRPIQHNAPAGQRYSSIRDAGEETLATYCQGFPQSPNSESFILPILFISVHPENVVQDCASLSETEKRSLKGLEINIRGERGEYEVYKVFYTIVRQSSTESILVLHGYKLDNDNSRNLKKYAIMNELPFIDLSGVNMKKEHDFVVIVQYIGIILCEVKTSASVENIADAESQLDNSETFVKQVLTAIAGPTCAPLPVVKVIIVSLESSTPSSPRKHNECHIIYQDDLQDFAPKWTQILRELKSSAQTSVIPPKCFETLVEFLVGVWLMKPITKRTYDFDNDQASLSAGVATIDSAVNRAEVAPTKQAQRLTSDVPTSMNEIFQRVDDFNIIYLSPKQKSVYDNYKQALINSPAGAGKTMLIVFKIIELLEADPLQKVLLVAPNPHHLRLEHILNKHNITTDIVTKFPYTKRTASTLSPPPLPACDVLIINIQDFFEVTRQTLKEYDISMFNVFVDDMHAYKVPYPEDFPDRCTFKSVGNFVDNTYNLLNTTNQYAWFGFDVVQQSKRYFFQSSDLKSDLLFQGSDERTCTLSIPVVTMANVLRSTKEITDVLDIARSYQNRRQEIFCYTGGHEKYMIKNIYCGHHITTGTRVLYERLQKSTNEHYEVSFVCDRVCALLNNLATTTSSQSKKQTFATVAVLFQHDKDLQKYKPSLQSIIRQQFNVGVQSIEEQLINNNNDDVIIDHSGNVHSFESPVVVFVRAWAHLFGYGTDIPVLYNMLSRARTQCVLVDAFTVDDPIPLQHVDYVMWEKVNETFKKV